MEKQDKNVINVKQTLNIMHVLEEELEALNFTAPLLYISFVDRKILEHSVGMHSCDFYCKSRVVVCCLEFLLKKIL